MKQKKVYVAPAAEVAEASLPYSILTVSAQQTEGGTWEGLDEESPAKGGIWDDFE